MANIQEVLVVVFLKATQSDRLPVNPGQQKHISCFLSLFPLNLKAEESAQHAALY